MAADQKLMLITGANSGIGLAAAKELCTMGHKLLVTVRSDEKGAQCIREVMDAFPHADIHYLVCEMSDPNSVRSLAEEVKQKWLVDGQLLDVLINNAGCSIASETRSMCKDHPEWEMTVAVNAIAPILLTDLLMDNLKETAAKKGEARVVMVNSSITRMNSLMFSYQTDLDDLMIAKPNAYTNGSRTYKNSKVALMLATLAMVKELEGAGVKLNSMCPGPIPGTNLFLANTPQSELRKVNCLRCILSCCIGQSQERGGNYIVQVAAEKRGTSHGLFYVRGKVVSQAPQCQDEDKQRRMLHMLRELPK